MASLYEKLAVSAEWVRNRTMHAAQDGLPNVGARLDRIDSLVTRRIQRGQKGINRVAGGEAPAQMATRYEGIRAGLDDARMTHGLRTAPTANALATTTAPQIRPPAPKPAAPAGKMWAGTPYLMGAGGALAALGIGYGAYRALSSTDDPRRQKAASLAALDAYGLGSLARVR